MGSQTQGNTLQDILKWEQENSFSREIVTVKDGEDLSMGAVVGKITKSIPTTGTPDEENTGQGTVTGVTGGKDARIGTYTLECVSVPSGDPVVPETGTPDGGNSGGGTVTLVSGGDAVKFGTYAITCLTYDAGVATFEVKDPEGNLLPEADIGAYTSSQINFTITDGDPTVIVVGDAWTIEVTEDDHDSGIFLVTAPDGSRLPDAVVGSAYVNSQINFTINDAETDFDIGDKFTVEVAAGGGEVVAVDFDAVDGSQEAFGFVIADYDATDGDVEGVAVVRDAIIVAADLVWPAGATSDQKAAAMAQMAAKGIVERTEV